MNKAIIFDLDGTLWETTHSTYTSLNEASKNHDQEEISEELVCDNYGNNKEASAKLFFPDLEKEEAFKILDESDELNVKNLTNNGGFIYPGLEDTLFRLHEKYDLYIVSNTSTKKYIESFLISSKLFKYFKDYIAASEIGLSKGDAISKLINDYSIDNAVYVGDTLQDYEASAIAGIPFIDCLYGYGEELNCDYKINNITELCDEVEKVFNEVK